MHAQVKRYLDVRRGRVADVVALEGRWALERAIEAGVDIDAVITCPSLLREHVEGDVEVGEKLFARLAGRDGPDGVVALATLPHRTLDDLAGGDRLVVADGLGLPGNLGTVIRCADGAGACGVIVCGSPLRLGNPTLVKASMGSLLWLPVVRADRADAVTWLRAHGVHVVAADPAATTSYRDAGYGPPAAVVVGSERRGLDPAWRAAADDVVAIPMLGRADSLNVGHAAALLLYEALHQQTTGT